MQHACAECFSHNVTFQQCLQSIGTKEKGVVACAVRSTAAGCLVGVATPAMHAKDFTRHSCTKEYTPCTAQLIRSCFAVAARHATQKSMTVRVCCSKAQMCQQADTAAQKHECLATADDTKQGLDVLHGTNTLKPMGQMSTHTRKEWVEAIRMTRTLCYTMPPPVGGVLLQNLDNRNAMPPHAPSHVHWADATPKCDKPLTQN